jgi:N-acetylmuramoyl-L-alanine amidase
MMPNRPWSRPASSYQVGSESSAFNALLRVAGALVVAAFLLAAPFAAAEQPAAPAAPAAIAARVTTTPERARLIIDLSAPTPFAVVSLGGPDRIAVDLQVGALSFDTPEPLAGSGLVSSYGVEMVEPGRARATLTLAGPAQVQQAYTLNAFADQPARLVIDLVPDSADNFSKRVATDTAAIPAGNPVPAELSIPPGASEATSVPPAPAERAPAAAPAAPAVRPKPLIVLDPGHGGIDSGARAPNGVMEKNIVLAFAKKLQALLIQSGRFDVALTRTDDSYLTLDQRVQLARQNKADLFISLHADSFSQPQVRGTSLYTRDEQATDELDKVLADNENKLELVSGFAVPKMTPQVVDALIDLLRRQMRKQSYLAAKSIVDALEPSVQMRAFPVRQADFFVLQAPDVPSMLVELGFMSNGDDIRNLTDPSWQDRVAQAMARGIADYFDAQGQAPEVQAQVPSVAAPPAAAGAVEGVVADAPAP